jgi:hypothetical protein
MTARRRRNWKLAAASAPLAILLAILAGQAFAAAGQPHPAWPAGVPAVPRPDCAAQGGGTALLPTSAELLAGGGVGYDYTIDGVDNEYIVPPPSFRPLTASQARLEEYAFPAKPAAALAQAHWHDAMAAYTTVPSPQLCLGDKVTSKVQPASGTASAAKVVHFFNWSGFYTRASSRRWDAAQGTWIQSKAGNCHCAGGTQEVTWAGIGGVSDGALLQAGTEMARSKIFAWYEYLHDCIRGDPSGAECGPSIIKVGNAKAGGNVFTQTSYQRSSHTANFFVEEGSHAFPIKAKKLNSTYYNGRSAEWVDERPSHCSGGCYDPLTNFKFNNWHSADAENISGAWQSVQSQNHVEVIMVNTRGKHLAQPSKLEGDTFKDTWIRAG